MSRLLERSFHWMLVSADEIHNPVQTKVSSDICPQSSNCRETQDHVGRCLTLENQRGCAIMGGRFGRGHSMVGAFAEPLRVNESGV